MQQIISRKEAREQGLKHYFTGNPCKYGHVSERFVSGSRCCVCARKYQEQNKDKVAKRDRKYREKNKGKIAERNRKYQEQNKEKITEQKRKYREKNKEKVAGRMRKYRERNKEKLAERERKWREENREMVAERMRKWHRANPEQVFIRNSLNRCMDNFAGKRAKAEELLGYTCEQLRSHIESQFREGMSWDNRSEWHIDHIKPVIAFIKEGTTDPAIINALDNLQPLWAKENLSKSSKF
ncbi:hypothetical protein VPHF89G1_0066 [Vibrio phage F89 g1]